AAMQTRPMAPRTLASDIGRKRNEHPSGPRPAPGDLGDRPEPPWWRGGALHYPRVVPMEPVVHLRDAVALLGRFPALAGIDLEVRRGEVVLLRGPNGAGKTTVLRVCAGLVPVVRGEAVVLGHDLRHDPRPVRRRVGLLGHATGLFDDLTVADNVA